MDPNDQPHRDGGLSFAAVLLCGGESSRMGKDKAQLMWQGRPLWQHQIVSLEQVSAHVAVAARKCPARLPPEVDFLGDDPTTQGPLGGVLSALRFVREHSYSHALLLAVDLPCVSPKFLRDLRSGCGPGRGVVTRTESGFDPLCAWYPRESLEAARDFACSGRPLRLQDLVGRLVDDGLLRVRVLGASEQAALFNVNHPADWSQLGGAL